MKSWLEVGRQCIKDEAEAVLGLIPQLDESFDKAVDIVLNSKGKLIVTGVGKSGHIGAKIAATLSSTGTSSFFMNALDAYHGDLGMIATDDVVLALRLGADGVHLGHNDMPLDRARAMSRAGFIIGGTANTFDDIRRLAEQGADYIGCGPYRFTTTKQKLSPVLGLEGYGRLLQQMREAQIHVPLVAIGGITEADIPALLQTGVQGIALSGSILRDDNPAEAMRRVCRLCEGGADS